ncbi:AAA family ATPase [Synechococcus sp. EJ6-Ellesmere]|uniref:AAA family ATPase n=1 Tax=Synechococcus sp. EJ6-Ellesmere TaxID=2823734 RepID=UPI0020CEE3B8|nr:SMC family ATPase [Synechococcus sp. EJ6-Ellesmere]MCP9826609.1 SMC family ATPase [Synechococcus sp. EJ6-Ellesmere]
MKPHHLRIEAFGPYAEPVEIGFDELSQEGLFLIHGTTGSGKTFLLDALCFALYGEVSGERSVKGLKSDHAEPAAVPLVSLDFSSGGARYLVERSPAYTALKTRGEGTTEKAPKAALYRLVGTEREVIVSRTTEVTREVEGLVGLNAGQFRQVILLPQGKFAEVLRAKADEREALLKTLFDTVVFEQAGYWLEDKAKAARGEVAEQNRAQEVLRNQAAREWSPYAPPPAEAEAEEEDAEAGDGVPTDQAGLDRLVQQIAAVVVETESSLKQATATLAAAQTAKADIDKVADRWDRRTAAKAKLDALESQRDPIEELKLQLATAVQAETLRTSVDAERTARAALTALQGSIKVQLQAAIRARDDAQALPVSVVLLDLLALPGLEDLGGATSDLAARRAEVSELAKKALEAAQARGKAAVAAGLASKAEADRTSSTTAKATRQQERQAAADAFTKACSARDQLDGLQRAAQEARERAGAVDALPRAQKEEVDAIAAKTSADQQVSKANAALVALRQRQIAGMAARLALGLEEGAPCPVCGSLGHPAPAQPSEDAVSDEAITAAETVLATATNAAEKAAVVVAEAHAARKAVLEKAGDAANDPDAARKASQQSSEALAAAQALAKTVDSLEQAISKHDQDLKALEAAIQTATTQIALQTKAAEDEAKRAETLSAEIAKELGEGVDPQAVLKTFVPLEAALKALAGSCQASTSATTRLEQASTRLEKELGGSEFADARAVEAALKDEPVRQKWAQQIQTFEKEVTEQKGILASPDLVELPEERPDTTAAAELVITADAARTEAVERHTQACRAQHEIQRLAGEHREGEASLMQKRERAQLLSAVADRCQGKAAPFISMQRWVLSAYLAEICRYANQRLELMTSGRYQLRLTDEGGRGGRNAGLGLRVLDAYTGEEREVSSLSGGETFQASLALALGVADTVQAHTGGVHLEALFIDEGFGTLDPDNLQLAMDELDRLREGGRMIGIISHVGALRERIRCGIQVVASDQGSRVCVGTPAML